MNILITGASRGIGAAAYALLQKNGHRVVGHSTLGSDALISGDLMDAGAPRDIWDHALDELDGRIDVLVNNAGITRDRSLRKMAHEDWQAVLRANLDSVFNMSKQAIEPMMAQRWGRIINISSVNGQQGAFGQVNYAAAKAGMHGFTKALALEVARRGVTVNTISPGYIGTKMVMAIPQEVLDSKIIPQIPMARLGKPEEIAGLVAYLASDEAAFLTGANIAINGGQHMY